MTTRRIPDKALPGLLLPLALAACQHNTQAPPAATTTATAAPAPAPAAAPAPGPAPAPAPALASPLVPSQVTAASTASQQDVQAGARLAAQGAGSVAACVSCHGANGEGNAQSGFPRLAALGRVYLVNQLESYADGRRKNAVMSPIASAMSAQQRQQAAAYYASIGPSPGARPSPARAPAREPVLAVRGDNRRELQSCANCHGPQGIGDAAANPYLAGQHAGYLTTALGEWKSGIRNNDPSGQMPRIAKALTDAEVRELVTYYASLPPPAPRNAQAAAVMPGTRAAVQSGPAGATAPSQGTGAEGGSPLTGGSQSQGAGGAATQPQNTPGNPR